MSKAQIQHHPIGPVSSNQPPSGIRRLVGRADASGVLTEGRREDCGLELRVSVSQLNQLSRFQIVQMHFPIETNDGAPKLVFTEVKSGISVVVRVKTEFAPLVTPSSCLYAQIYLS